MRRISAIILISVLAACGGGGGGGSGGSDSAFYGGRWNGALFLASNNCGADVDQVMYIDWLVNQDGNRVVVEAQPSGATYVGTATADGFEAQSPEFQSSSGLPQNASVMFQELEGDEAIISAYVSVGICEVAYTGAANRE